MLLISDEELEDLQKSALNEFYLDFLKNLENNQPIAIEYTQPRAFIFELFKAILIGRQEYLKLYSLVEEVMLNRNYLFFFDKVHTKEELLDFIKKIY